MRNLQKTKIGGIYYNTKTEKFDVSTTFTTKDKIHKRETKRGFDTLKDANLWKVNRFNEIKSKTLVQLESNGKEVEYLLDRYIEYKSAKNKPTTIKNIRFWLNKYFLTFFGNMKVEDIKPTDIEKFYQTLSKTTMKNQCKNLVIVYVLGFVEWLQLMEYISISIYNKFKIILTKFNVIEKAQNNFLEYDDFKKFISTFDKNTREGLMLHLLFTTMFFGGMRIGELLGLQYNDIDFTNNTIHIYKQAQYIFYVDENNNYNRYGSYYILPFTKTNSIKLLEMPQWLINEIKELMQIDNASFDDFIFTYKREIVITQYIRFHLEQHLKLANLEHIRLHDFRHSNVTWLYDNGADAKYVQERMGHSSVETSLKIYSHITSQRKERNSVIIKEIEQV